MVRGRDVARSNARTAMPENRNHDHTLGREVRHRIWGTLKWHQPLKPGSQTSRRAASKPPMRGRPTHGNAQVKSSTCQATEADATPGEGERQQGQKKKGQDPLPRWLEVHTHSPCQKRRQKNVEPTPLQSRPADQRMTQGHPEAWPETAPKSPEPNCSNSFIRDQINRSRPDSGTPSWRNTEQLTKAGFVTIECAKKHTRPAGWPHREATKDRWTEEAFVPIECAEKHHPTRNGWPHREG